MWISTQHDRPTTDHILCIRQIFEKKWEYIEALNLVFIDSRMLVMELGVRFYIIFSLSLVSP